MSRWRALRQKNHTRALKITSAISPHITPTTIGTVGGGLDVWTTTVIVLGEAEDVMPAFCEVVEEGVIVEDMVDGPEDIVDGPEDIVDGPEDIMDEPEDMMGKPAFCRDGIVAKPVAGTKATCGQLGATPPPTEMHPGSWVIGLTNPTSSSGITWVYVQASTACIDWLVILNKGHLSVFPVPRRLHLSRICAQAPVRKPFINSACRLQPIESPVDKT